MFYHVSAAKSYCKLSCVRDANGGASWVDRHEITFYFGGLTQAS